MGNRRICNDILHITVGLLSLVILLGGFPHLTLAEVFGEEEAYDVILEVKRDRKVLSAAMFGLEKNGKYYIPIQGLGRIVNFNVKTSVGNKNAKGFFISDENQYSINVEEGTYTLRGKSYEFDKSEAFVFTQQLGIGDIYVTTDLLNQIWPLDLEINPLKQELQITTARKLPYELSLARERKRNNHLNNTQNNNEEYILPKIENDYKMLSLPAIDFSSTTRVDGNESGIGQNINIRGRNDLLKAEASYNFGFEKETGDSIDFQNARLLLERKSYDEGELPFGIQLAQFGDIRPRPSRLIDGALIGRGLLFSTEPQKQIRDFDQITIEGEAEPGWEVELYRGNELIDFQVVNNQGEYRFENVVLNFSNTVIKTILYGPEGQIREEEETYNISNSMLKSGKNIFEASVLDLNRDLILTGKRSKNTPEGVAHNYKVKRGISKWLSAFATFTGMPTQDENRIEKSRNYATVGADIAVLGVSGAVEAYKDFSGGTAYDLRAASRFKGVNVNLRTALYSDFESEEARYGESARTSRTEFSLSKPFQVLMGSLGLRFKLDHETFEKNLDRTDIDFSQTLSANGLRITHGNTINLTDKNHQNSDGRINAAYKLNSNWQLRSLLNYDIFPDKELRNLLSELRYRDGNKFTTALDVNRSFRDQSTRIGANISYDFDKFRAGFNTDWDKDEGFRAFLRATFSAAPYGKDNEYTFNSKNLSNRGALNGHVFLDKNYDGKFNSGDEPIKDAKIKIGLRETSPSTEDGYAIYTGASKNSYENITLDIDSLNNPYTISGVDGYSAVLRPSRRMFLDFPVIETGIIEGEIVTDTGSLAGVRMELLSGDKVIDTTSSAFDGYYGFEYVEPGTYTVRIDPSYEQVKIPPRQVLVTSEKLFHDDVAFQIFEQAGEEACVDRIEEDGRITQDCQPIYTTRDGIQLAHTNSHWIEGAPIIKNVRMAKRPTYLRLVLDHDQKPSAYQVIKTLGDKELSIILPGTNWGLKEKWDNLTPGIIEGYQVEYLPNGDTKLILKAVSKIRIKQQEVLPPDNRYKYHRIYFDFVS